MLFAERLLAQLDEIVEVDVLVSHPFALAWQRGTLSRDDLRLFAVQFHQQLSAFPRCVSSVHAITEELSTRRTLLELLAALEGRTPAIAELWVQTCAAMGLFSDSLREARPTAATEACINDFLYLAQSGTVAGLATLLAFMRPLPALCKHLRDGLVEHYGIDGGPGLEFFDVASYVLGAQAKAIRAQLSREIHSEEDARTATHAAEAARTALFGLLSGAVPASV